MKLLLFKIKLLVLLGLFLIRLVANISDKTKPIIASSFLLILVVFIVTVASRNNPTPEEYVEVSPTRLPKYPEQYELFAKSTEEITEELNTWLKISEAQPKSRNVLLNVSFLYAALGDEQRANLYLEKAKSIAPNHELVQ